MKKLEESTIDDLATYLVEGSVWQNKRGKQYTVMAVTNVTVKPELQNKFIPSVVFLNKDNEVFSLDCESFLRVYSFVEVNEVVASCIDNCYKANIGEYNNEPSKEDVAEQLIDEYNEDTVDEEVVDLSDNKEVEEEVTAETPRFAADFICNEPEGPVLSSEELREAFVGYSQYIDASGTIFHKLLFKRSERVSQMYLAASFDPDLYQDECNTYQSIKLITPDSVQVIEWDTFGCITLELKHNEEFLAVILGLSKVGQEELSVQPQTAIVEEEVAPVEIEIESSDASTVEVVNVEPVEEAVVPTELPTSITPEEADAVAETVIKE